MRVDDFDYPLPPTLIAQHPPEHRDSSRLLVLNRAPAVIHHHAFSDLPNLLQSTDVLVVNNSRVVPARLRARKPGTGGQVEVFLAEEIQPLDWWALLKPGKRVHPGTHLDILDAQGQPSRLTAVIREKSAEGLCRVQLEGTSDLFADLEDLGEVPLPPYIHRDVTGPQASDRERYQTVYAQDCGSVAAPTAGLHFTERLLDRLKQRGVTLCKVTLHVGLGTFAPIKTRDLENHALHAERYEVSPEAAASLQTALDAGRRIVAVGTTSVRVLETVAAQNQGRIVPGRGTTRLFLHPPADFRVVGALITNFHLPKSSLLMLVSAFAAPGQTHGRDDVLRAYAEAVRHGYRFFSYGDAMLIQ